MRLNSFRPGLVRTRQPQLAGVTSRCSSPFDSSTRVCFNGKPPITAAKALSKARCMARSKAAGWLHPRSTCPCRWRSRCISLNLIFGRRLQHTWRARHTPCGTVLTLLGCSSTILQRCRRRTLLRARRLPRNSQCSNSNSSLFNNLRFP